MPPSRTAPSTNWAHSVSGRAPLLWNTARSGGLRARPVRRSANQRDRASRLRIVVARSRGAAACLTWPARTSSPQLCMSAIVAVASHSVGRSSRKLRSSCPRSISPGTHDRLPRRPGPLPADRRHPNDNRAHPAPARSHPHQRRSARDRAPHHVAPPATTSPPATLSCGDTTKDGGVRRRRHVSSASGGDSLARRRARTR
jgi:hypothetical protein